MATQLENRLAQALETTNNLVTEAMPHVLHAAQGDAAAAVLLANMDGQVVANKGLIRETRQ
jgi:hypothetical protein